MIVDRCYRRQGISYASVLLDGIKALGYKYPTKAGITVGIDDIKVPEAKKQIMADAEAKVLAGG